MVTGRTAARLFRWAAPAIALLLPVSAPFADSRVQTEIENATVLLWDGKSDREGISLTGSSRATVEFHAPPAPNVQGRLQLRVNLTEISADEAAGETALLSRQGFRPTLIEIPRAMLRFRFPVTEDYTMRVTTGRDRLSWGLGSLFNAGDLLFGADGRSSADFTRDEDVRDETAWLLSGYFPIGELGYLETVTLPPIPQLLLSPDSGDAAFSMPSINHTRTGLRIHGSLGHFSVETAYLFDDPDHRAAAAIQGTAFDADIYGAGSLAVPANPDALPDWETLFSEHSALSAGIFRAFRLSHDQNLTARLETLVRPGESWKPQAPPDYAVQLHPELIWTPNRTLTAIARGVISPVDASAELTAGADWNIFQGFTAMAFVVGQIGPDAPEQLYAWGRPTSLAATIGFRYRF